MGKGRALLGLHYGKEQRDVRRKGRKRGLWAQIGMGIGGMIAIGLTGGAATPFVAGLMAAGGVAAGGLAGSYGAKEGWFKTEKAKLKGEGKFLEGTRGDVVSDIHAMIGVGAAKAGLFAGFSQAGGWKGLMKKGPSGEKIGLGEKIFSRAPGSGQTEGFGKMFDFRGSKIGQGLTSAETSFATFKDARLQKSRSALQTGEGMVPSFGSETGVGTGTLPRGKGGVPDLDSLFQEELSRSPTEGFLDQDVYRAQAGQVDFTSVRDPRGQTQGGNLWDLSNVNKIDPSMHQIPGVTSAGGKLSAAEIDVKRYYENVGMDDTTYISRKKPQSTLLKDVGVGGDFLESSNIRNTPQYVAGRHGEESFFSRALDTDDIVPSSIKGGNQGITMPDIKPAVSNQPQIPNFQEISNLAYDTANESISWKDRMFPSKGGSKLLRSPGGYDPRY